MHNTLTHLEWLTLLSQLVWPFRFFVPFLFDLRLLFFGNNAMISFFSFALIYRINWLAFIYRKFISISAKRQKIRRATDH